ncbi:hypothetical protein NDU88_007268 [Pleurodeles waltl]|uniref:Uncharacterized protein n=1 Tax=Pleurodeles waltl TaxID=8319 RepID=A0AAV7MEQ3_PLEWA|nr:hypothetical protein NDU88_007268 [Pleurodeles waltl]
MGYADDTNDELTDFEDKSKRTFALGRLRGELYAHSTFYLTRVHFDLTSASPHASEAVHTFNLSRSVHLILGNKGTKNSF